MRELIHLAQNRDQCKGSCEYSEELSDCTECKETTASGAKHVIRRLQTYGSN
jgi:hypothetical protein